MKSSVINLEGWVVVHQGNRFCLGGFTSNHPRWLEGGLKLITTSQVVGRVGDDVITRSGSVYRLGTPGGREDRAALISRLDEVDPALKQEVFAS